MVSKINNDEFPNIDNDLIQIHYSVPVQKLPKKNMATQELTLTVAARGHP